jgi:hypothetical protein
MQATYPMKVQAIRSRKQSPRFYVNIPLPLAAAMELEAGEAVRWQLLSRRELRLARVTAPPAARPAKSRPRKQGVFQQNRMFRCDPDGARSACEP